MDGHPERFALTRWRWRMRGAWLWPTFIALTIFDSIMLRALPVAGEHGPDGVVPSLILAGILNLLLVAVPAYGVGWLLRRRRDDLPRAIAHNYAGTFLVSGLAIGLVVAGIVHHPQLESRRNDRAAAGQALRAFILAHRKDLQVQLRALDVLYFEERGQYRACVPLFVPNRSFCAYVNTRAKPPKLLLDPDQTPNEKLRVPGGFE